MKKKVLFWGLMLLTVFNVAALTTFGYHRLTAHDNLDTGRSERRDRTRGGERGSFLRRELNLNDEQTARIDRQRDELRALVEPIRRDLDGRREAMFQLLMAEAPDRTAIDTAQSEIDSLQAAVQHHMVDYLLGLKETLTPEQQSRFYSIVKRGPYGGSSRRSYRPRQNDPD